eukprot:1662007-Rhodomonas_salina.1
MLLGRENSTKGTWEGPRAQGAGGWGLGCNAGSSHGVGCWLWAVRCGLYGVGCTFNVTPRLPWADARGARVRRVSVSLRPRAYRVCRPGCRVDRVYRGVRVQSLGSRV